MKIVIQGAGEVGSHLAKMLSLEANDITVIDDDPQRLANISSIADVIAIEGSPSSLRVSVRHRCRTLICSSPSCLSCHRM